jgi:predicted nucleic acid-binding Zn ribbon protein
MGVLDQGRQLEIYANWPRLVGNDVARNSRPLKLRNGTLTLAVANATWMQQLTMLKPTLLQAINDNLGQGIVFDIKLTTRDFHMES